MESKCMGCEKHEHQQGQECPANNTKCKACHKIGHSNKVFMSTKRQQGATRTIAMAKVAQEDPDAYIDELGAAQTYTPKVNMIRVIIHIDAHKISFHEGKHLKFPTASHPREPFDDHLKVRVDTGADVKCIIETTNNELFPDVKLSVCPHEIQNFGNSAADISILGQFCTYLLFKGKKYENTFIVTNASF